MRNWIQEKLEAWGMIGQVLWFAFLYYLPYVLMFIGACYVFKWIVM